MDFLCYLFDRLKLAVSKIEGYRAMLGPVLRSNGIDLSTERVVGELITSFRTQRPRSSPSTCSMPDWDIAFVLYTLTVGPWEPLGEVSLQRLTLKTFFLVLLASGRRRSDLHAIDLRRVAFATDGSVTLLPALEFVPKTRAAMEGNKAFSPISIPPLAPFVGANEPDSLICPVRAIKMYIKRSRSFRRGRNRLFMSYQRNRSSDISVTTLSNWVKYLVKCVYQESNVVDQVRYKITAHQLRHVAMSLACRGSVPMETLIRAGMWTKPTSFLSFYLADASEALAQSKRFRLGPIAVSQSVVR